MKNGQWLFVNHPEGKPKPSDFKYVECETPELKEGQVLVKHQYVSVDPYMRGRLAKTNRVLSYAPGYKQNEVVQGGSVGEVVETKSPLFKVGDTVVLSGGWQRYAVADASAVRKFNNHGLSNSLGLGVLGMPGATAFFGLLDICNPQKGETVLVSTAAGAVGMIVGQIAKIRGATVVGTTGSEDKAEYLRKELGFDTVINYKSVPSLREAIKEACPNGVDVYFDNVGGETLDIAVSLLNKYGRIAICGAISQYNNPEGHVEPGPNLTTLIGKEGKIQGFLVGSFFKKWEEAFDQIAAWIQEGKIKYRETVYEGIEKIPEAFIALFEGTNLGKIVIKID